VASAPVFGFLAPNKTLRLLENSRINGLIPSLAIISRFLIFERVPGIARGLSAAIWAWMGLFRGLLAIRSLASQGRRSAG
jgi:hypothetical protein